MIYLAAGIILTMTGIVLMKTDTSPLAAPFVLTAGIILSFIGSIRIKNK